MKTQGVRVSKWISITLVLLLVTGSAFSQASHNVTIVVPSMVHSLVTPAGLTITIDGSGTSAGGSSFQKIDETSIFYWASNYTAGKVTVQTNLAATNYTLHIYALNPTAPGVSAGDFILSQTAHDLITGVGLSMGSSTIRFTGIALATQTGGLSDNHSLTYTVTIL